MFYLFLLSISVVRSFILWSRASLSFSMLSSLVFLATSILWLSSAFLDLSSSISLSNYWWTCCSLGSTASKLCLVSNYLSSAAFSSCKGFKSAINWAYFSSSLTINFLTISNFPLYTPGDCGLLLPLCCIKKWLQMISGWEYLPGW